MADEGLDFFIFALGGELRTRIKRISMSLCGSSAPSSAGRVVPSMREI
jgi:hypothetical protein